MLNGFLTWWGEMLRDMQPARLSGGARGMSTALVVEPVPGAMTHVTLSLRRGRTERGLGTFDVASAIPVRSRVARTVLRLPPGTALARDLVLPLAAERQVTQVVRYEIDRLTPFTADQLYWTCILRNRDPARNKLNLRLVLVTRASLDPLLASLARSGIVPTTLETEDSPGQQPVRIDLRGDPALRPSGLGRLADRGLAAACAMLIAAVVATPFVLQERDAARVEARIAALRPQVEAAEAVRRQIAAASAGGDVVAAARLRFGDTLAVLAAVTALLPDDTSLTDLTLRSGRLTMSGQSAAAARLIAVLSADPAIRNPDFAAPVTRVNDGRADLFSIRADVAP